MRESVPELIQLPRSHFNEKARWGFDFKRVPHKRTSMLAGLQRRGMRKLTGQPLVPVARFGENYAIGSAAILEELERYCPEPALLPKDEAQRAEVLEIQHHFDETVGPSTRCGVFAFLLNDSEFFARVFADHVGLVRRKLYQGFAAATRPTVQKAFGLNRPGTAEKARMETRQALDWVATQSDATGYLVGDRFSLADLVAASLLALTIDTGHPAMRLPEPWSNDYREWLALWQDHPGTTWVRIMYDRHRGSCAAL